MLLPYPLQCEVMALPPLLSQLLERVAPLTICMQFKGLFVVVLMIPLKWLPELVNMSVPICALSLLKSLGL